MSSPLSEVPCSTPSSRTFSYDVFPSFSGEDVRQRFLSHLLKDFERNDIVPFKDNEMERSQSIAPLLLQAINDSRIAVVVFSEHYASSSWCLNELLEIMKCKKEFGQMVIPVFYELDPCDVRKQLGNFGDAFTKTCHNKPEEDINQWKQALETAANIHGYHSKNCPDEAKMIETISNEILGKLIPSSSDDFEDYVGIKDNMAEMRLLLQSESEEVRMVGIWGASGTGKTTIARALFSRHSRHFQGKIFIDRGFISKCMEGYGRTNFNDPNAQLRLQETFLYEIFDHKNMKVCAMEEKLKHKKVLVIIDDLDDQDVLDTIARQAQSFGCGSRIIVVTTDRRILRAYEINHIYEVHLPSEEHALEMFCRAAFKQNSPPEGLIEFASEAVKRAGGHPLALNVLGSHLRGFNKEDCSNMLSRFGRSLDGKIEKALIVSYDGLGSEEDKATFRHIACRFNHRKAEDIKLYLADSELDVDIGLKNLVDKSLIQVRSNNEVEMHGLLEEMGKEIVRRQSHDEPGKREFLVDDEDIRNGTKIVLSISFDASDTGGEISVHEDAFKNMPNLRFLIIYDPKRLLRLPEKLENFPSKLKILTWWGYPMRCLPTNFCHEYLVVLVMWDSKLKKLWEGVVPLKCLKKLSLCGSKNLKVIPNLSMATNLEQVDFSLCLSLVELPSTIIDLHKLMELRMEYCVKLERIPTNINLPSLKIIDFQGCSRLKSFNWNCPRLENLDMSSCLKLEMLWKGVVPSLPCLRLMDLERCYKLKEVPDLSMATNLEKLCLSFCASLVKLPSSIRNLNQLTELNMQYCIKLEVLPTGIDLKSLDCLNFSGCIKLKTFPNISTNISTLCLKDTSVVKVPTWINKFSRLQMESLEMNSCSEFEKIMTRFELRCLRKTEALAFSIVRWIPDTMRQSMFDWMLEWAEESDFE